MNPSITIIGGGLAGCEAAWQIAERGIPVKLYEMRSAKTTSAHTTGYLAELVCSNSLRSNSISNAAGLLKEEMRVLGSLIINTADETKVPAGLALAVDRVEFADRITTKISGHKNIKVIREEVISIPDNEIVIIATGPMTSEALSDEIIKITGNEYLYFYDAIAPIVEYDSLEHDKIFRASRYNKENTADYLNCPLTKEEYYNFVDALISGEKYPVKDFEKGIFFEGCMPIEQMAERGRDTLLFGPMKPVGLVDPHTGKMPFAVVQLRQDNKIGSLYNLVGFQTRLLWKEQDRTFRMISGLQNTEFMRYGSMHRNTFINSPGLLKNTNQLKNNPDIFFAGQLTGVEGYVESTSSGLITGINAANYIRGKSVVSPPPDTACGALLSYISDPKIDKFQPMNINYGIISVIDSVKHIRDRKERYAKIADKALINIKEWKEKYCE
ncbi:methylenetetrahydrofolate--tRNA-(uracil(54)-C(5))-methyltransferase (FADH(2)-oxidizing) TrmFO [Candidatus Desantisbacteria bacterium]|nr:methylenetetrahydrofolate--tRNA-(uracil(54)-C(5))-methyltransferase (FADH(2)-oxidizing) TrmFO [Candidatus Desantisbacteria bacterium]